MSREVWKSEPQLTVVDLMARRLESDADGPYLDVCGTALTARQVHTAAASLARALVEMGVTPGDRVATLVENSPQASLAWWGAITAGAVAVPINTAYKGAYLRHQLADSGSTVLFVVESLADRVARVLGELDDLAHVVLVPDDPGSYRETAPGEPAGDAAPAQAGQQLAAAAGSATIHAWDDLLGADPIAPSVAIGPADLATFIYTGGTTGPSKGCMLSHHYHGALADQIGICWRRTADDVVWTPLPLFHFNALATAVVGRPGLRRARRRSTAASRCRTSGPR